MKSEYAKNPNPAGKHGKPFTLAPMTFDDALRKILSASPSKGINPVQHSERKAAPKIKEKPAKKRPAKSKK